MAVTAAAASGQGGGDGGGDSGGERGGNGDEGTEALGDDGTAMLWCGVATQPTRVAASVTSLPRSALLRHSRGAGPAAEVEDTTDVANGDATHAATPTARTDAHARTPCADAQAHTLVLNYRGLKPLPQLEAQIASLRAALGEAAVEWSAGADLASGAGSQQASFVHSSALPQMVEEVMATLDGEISLKYEPNPGRSDASHLWRSLPAELRGERVVPFTCGPGHRSHRCQSERVMRKTHGPHEGFEKETGRVCLPFFVRLCDRFRLEAPDEHTPDDVVVDARAVEGRPSKRVAGARAARPV